MAYQALYRVYRPRTFEDMIGQEVITQTLKNAIETHQTGHAYLFSGPRGTGKTSAAKIFAREVNGIAPETDDSQIPDIVEFDAASNSRVEDMRDILSNVDYAPIEAEFKVYIIDEVHMLSNSAFNALLKTLEEPPANVKFILATTEPQKVPVTILSRTQRFEFKRIDGQAIAAHLADVLKQQHIDFDQDALRIIANVAEGGMRDALSILDQVIAFGTDTVTVDNALQVTGSTTTTQLMQYLTAVTNSQTPEALKLLHDILVAGKDAQRFVSDIIGLLRDIMLANIAPELIKSTAPLNDLRTLAQQLNSQQIQAMMGELDDIQKQLLQTMQSDVYLELLTVKLGMMTQGDQSHTESTQHATRNTSSFASPESLNDPTVTTQPVSSDTQPDTTTVIAEPTQNEGVSAQENLEATHDTVKPIAQSSQYDESEAVSHNNSLARTGQLAVFAILQAAKRDTLSRSKSTWATLISTFNVAHQALLTIASPVAASQEGLVVAFDYPALLDQALKDVVLQEKLIAALREQNLPTALVLISKDDWQQERAEYVKQLKAGTTQTISLSDVPYVSQQEVLTTATDATITATDAVIAPKVVTEAQKLFGNDIVTVVD
ncbi:DNA polymerase III subunit gamma/tau [Leuconostoc citreum]|uniref:DNA polymerase III subunit gamma/tau n=1 Tax=Leuconostoc citreum TaxID=33964 RepID=UPI000246630D|nr:DNA polymerase III subunit gamma/tau [Leuconostoc citreum]MCP1276730.1 DNA polymerase III subunit gamma/tau [Leuconostoc citreum]MCS8587671.1 DNA polymerase III subunit gamma/tau [Leuconostoc citreum]MCS8594494.1 DNA polymerase III subunit gamma/tau [Leuconostoc citreum]MCS8599309.1 DNA polymerase III subunit gamma/tau [Leuconostoc citreum]CCF23743.1 DNA polymerase III, gamma/tau subunit [Leuconostoc citreum LBAE C10]